MVGPGVLRDTLEYPPTTEGSIMVGRNNNNDPSHHYSSSTSDNAAPSGPLGGLGGLLATPASTVGGRFRRSYFGQFVFLVGLLSLIVFMQDSLLSSSRLEQSSVVVVGSEQDVGKVKLEDSSEYRPVETVDLSTDPSFLQQQQGQEQQQHQRKVGEAVSGTLVEHDGNTAAHTRIIPNSSSNDNNDQRGMRAKTKQWIKTFANIIIGHEPEHGLVDDEGLAVFIPEIKQVGQDAKIVSLPVVLDVPGQASIPKYESLPDPTIDLLLSPAAARAGAGAEQHLPPHAEHHWTGISSIQKALDPTFQDPADLSPRPRPQDNGDQVSRLEIVQWQQEQDLSECRERNDGYEHEIEGLRHVVEEQDSDLRELRRQVDELKAQAAAIEAELE
ncbi:hypothetical protein BGZ95_011908 [Linnemannia exigua]|uniref:Transmembrane protein n=1 Tax=Linnemannia exigua TaxID=604196 RepID=A0AAD4DBC3_9FUNG|nr:hypothetical protein BGZ95_011908 [Linnemannia exigua]